MKMLLYQGKNRSFRIVALLLLFLSLIGCTNPEGGYSSDNSGLDAENTTSEELPKVPSTAPTQSENLEEQQGNPASSDLSSETAGREEEENSVKRWNINESLLKVSQLNSAQVEKLMTVEGAIVQGGEIRDSIFRVVLPGYIPSGFKLTKFSFKDPNLESGVDSNELGYSLTYKDSNNICFRVGAFASRSTVSPPIPPSHPLRVETIEAYSPIFGKLRLNYTGFDEYSNPSKIELDSLRHSSGGYVYDFASRKRLLYSEANCNTMELEEAVKVVESLQYLNP